MVAKNWTRTPSASGSYGRLAGWLAGWQTKDRRIAVFKKFPTSQTIRILTSFNSSAMLLIIVLEMHFTQLFLNKANLEAQNIWLTFFFIAIPTIKYVST